MKKNYVYALMSAVALLGAVSLSACSTSDDVVDVNPTFDGEAVKTQFTISFPQNVAKTRQTAGTVQQTEAIEDFRGMEEIVLYPFAAIAAAGADPVGSSSTKLGNRITLSKLVKPTSANVNNTIPAYTTSGTGLTENNNSVLFNDVTIPIGTGSFLFYGKAIDNTTYTDKFYNGSLISSITSTSTTDEPVNITFDLDPTYTATSASTIGAALATYLTSIAQAKTTETTPKAWSDCEDGSALKDLYDKFISLKAGSSLTVQAAVQDLYSSVRNNTDLVSQAIVTAITNSTYVSSTTGGELTFESTLNGFPADVNLPDGAALLSWDGTNKEFAQSNSGSDLFGTTGTSKITNAYADYVYPASLYYYCNSGIGTATTSQADEYKSDNNTWNDVLTGHYTAAQQVKSSTRSVAILDPIQYAVGRLDMTVAALTTTEEGGKKVMYDKKGEAYDATNGFEVTGVLIGGQKQVGFDFTTNTSADEKTIYDNITKSQPGTTRITVTPSAASAPNYTLALETEAKKDVYVAVEFLNKGADFEGVDGVIPAGCKFYLVGKLSPTASSGVSGYNESTMNQVFRQDYKTIANFSISQNTGDEHKKGLGAAYNTIPDLRTPQLELGLSVDLHWETGITFTVEF